MQRLYQELSLPCYQEAQPHFQAYLETQFNFQPDIYTLNEETKKHIYKRWRFVFDTYGYQP